MIDNSLSARAFATSRVIDGDDSTTMLPQQRSVMRWGFLLLMLSLLMMPLAASASDACPGVVYGKGKRAICLPLGERSFADALVEFVPGDKPSEAPFNNGERALGPPDFVRVSSPDYVSIGCDGVLALQFVDNVLVDVEGPDLYIFEVGPMVEKTSLAISTDGEAWIDVGMIEGARAEIDIAPFASEGERYGFVRLTNASTACGGRHSGADIDAVAAVGAALRLSLDSAVLFDVGAATLRDEARAALDELLDTLRAQGAIARLTVEGHTDSTGTAAANQTLSEARADAVWRYLEPQLGLDGSRVSRIGYGASRPVASNDDESGRARNRRVDLLVVPQQ